MIDDKHYQILIDNEDFMSVIFKLVECRETNPSATNLKLEALWILINLAYGDDEDILKFVADERFTEAMKIVMLQSQQNFQVFDLLMFLMCNLTFGPRTRSLVKEHFDLCSLII